MVCLKESRISQDVVVPHSHSSITDHHSSDLNAALQSQERTQQELHSNESGAGLVEYALLIALIMLTAMPSITFFTDQIAAEMCRGGAGISESEEIHRGALNVQEEVRWGTTTLDPFGEKSCIRKANTNNIWVAM